MFEDKKELLLLGLGILLSLGLGCAVGLSYNQGGQEAAPAVEMGEEGEESESVVSNKVVKFISKSVSGTVKSLSDQTLVLEEGGDTLTVEVALDARIVRVAPPSPTREEIRLSQVKVRDKVDALLYSQPDGSFLANEVSVIDL